MKIFLCLALLVAAVSANSYSTLKHGGYETLKNNKFVEIVRLTGLSDNKGNYNFESETADGTKLSETGGLKMIKGKAASTKEGSVSWTSPEGKTFSLTYTADENGFHPVGSHLPVAPPVPEEIKRVLPLLPKLDLSMYDKETATEYKPASYSHYTAPMKPVAPPTTFSVITAPSTLQVLPPSPPVVPVLEAPTKTHVQTSEFVIDSEPTRTFFKIGH